MTNNSTVEQAFVVRLPNALSRLCLYTIAMNSISHVAVVRALPGLGDLLCLTPTLRALRQLLPAAEITYIGLPKMRWLADRYTSYIDHFLDFPGWPGIPEREPNVRALPAWFAQVQGRFDLALQLHGSGLTSNGFTVMLGAAQTAGHFLPGHYCPSADTFLPYTGHVHEAHLGLNLLDHLGLATQALPNREAFDFPLLPADCAQWQTFVAAHDLRPAEYAVLHPGASASGRRWGMEKFAAVGDALAERGLRIVLTGVAAEAELTAAVDGAMQHDTIDLAGQTPLGALAAGLADARLLVSNDTGVSHLAVATQTPSVVIFLASEPRRWGPLDRVRHRVVDGLPREGEPAHEVTVARVVAEVEGVLSPASNSFDA